MNNCISTVSLHNGYRFFIGETYLEEFEQMISEYQDEFSPGESHIANLIYSQLHINDT